ncbi:hypothetical protein [Aeromicrobium sp. 9AM]|uniref:hypothetical protein n=1 Tax=Aeromicrobium sp. 9AM TaxID=2653126 RepID=UPI0012EFC92A|nr:hypothetical protein [Aeromicrobium sp. 9AM]VXC31661.1 conserved hypothetical protein [Aeromicrobium sp. 9AM]
MNVDELLKKHAPSTTGMRDEAGRLRSDVLTTALAETGDSYATVLPRVRRRRTLVRLTAAAAVLAVVGAGLSLTFGGSSPASAAQERFTNAGAAPAYGTYGAFSAGRTVYIGNHQVTFDEKIKAMYYTSEGVLVRMGRVDYTDDNGPSHYSLIRPDGSHSNIDLRMGDRVVATDPSSPDVAYAEPAGKRWSFVVVNLVTGKEVARTTVDGAFTWGGWEAPPVTMAGHRMWALFDAGWMEYDWKSGATRMIPGTKNAPLSAAHGQFLQPTDKDETHWALRDFVTGRTLQTVQLRPATDDDMGHVPSPELSPDGRFIRLDAHYTGYDDKDNLIQGPGPFQFIAIASGKVVDLDRSGPLGWTPGGNTLEVDAKSDKLVVCKPATGRCDRIDLPISGEGKVKLGGLPYES